MRITAGVEVDTTGLDELRARLDQLSGTESVSLEELLTPEFMTGHTQYDDDQEWFDDSTLELENANLLDSPIDLDAYVARTTDFADWGAMLEAAYVAHLKLQLEG